MMFRNACWMLTIGLTAGSSVGGEPGDGVVLEEFIYEKAPFEQCHASTIAESTGGLVVAWFGGTEEGDRDVGIWLSRREGETWTRPVEVAEGTEDGESRYPCWNPVLFQPEEKPLLLFYKVGPNPRQWWGRVKTSADGGRTWSESRRLPQGILGPVKNKPVMLGDGTLLCGSSTEHDGWRVHFERTRDLGRNWKSTGPVPDAKEFAAIQPTILEHPEGVLQALCRSRQRRITETWSKDGGRSWSSMKASRLPNPNSGIDAVTLSDGRHLLVYNHTERGRSPLNVAVSRDGKAWKPAVTLETESGEFSYPAVIQTADGRVHVTYTWKRRRIRHVVLDPSVASFPLSGGEASGR